MRKFQLFCIALLAKASGVTMRIVVGVVFSRFGETVAAEGFWLIRGSGCNICGLLLVGRWPIAVLPILRWRTLVYPECIRLAVEVDARFQDR